MDFRPLRLPPGADLRRALEDLAMADGPAFVVAGIGSLSNPRLRLADAATETALQGPWELLTLSGSLTPDGAHLHATVADAEGAVLGGHLAYGNEVRTTAEVLVASLAGWQLGRQLDTRTGYLELVISVPPALRRDSATASRSPSGSAASPRP
jgi:predicted DNA-binding protein with PD1-like motif